MKKHLKKAVSLILILSMIVTTQVAVFSQTTEKLDNQTILELNDEYGIVRIDYEKDNEGTIILKQYLNGVLTDKNVIKTGSDIVTQTTYHNPVANKEKLGLNINVVPQTRTYKLSDFIVDEKSPELNLVPNYSSALASTSLGRINYKALDGTEGIVKYSLDVSYTQNYMGTSTYTIKSFAGKLVDLITLLIGAVALPEAITATFIRRVLLAAGITIIGGKLSNALSTTVAATETDYVLKLVNVKYPNITKNVYGERYYVTDYKYYSGETYFEGYVPQDWGTQTLGIGVHNEMFGYSNFSIESWN